MNLDFAIRQARETDLPEILTIYAAAREQMRAAGNETQWGSTYPPEETVREDLAAGHLYVLETKSTEPDTSIQAVFCFFTGDEPLYHDPDARWTKEEPYGVVHRIASKGTVKGAGAACLRWAVEQAGYLRIDTHKDNKAMQHVLRKLGFQECGSVKAHDGTPRLAFDAAEEDLS